VGRSIINVFFAGLVLLLAGLPAHAQVVTVGLLASYPPFQTWPEGGAPSGLDVDLMRRLERETGLRFEFRRYDQCTTMLLALKSGEIQVATAMAHSPERATFLQFTRPYASVGQAFVGPRTLTSVPGTPDLAGRRLGVVAGHVVETISGDRYPLASRTAFPTVAAAVEALARDDIDFVFETVPVLRAELAAQGRTELTVLRTYGFPEGHLRLATPLAEAGLVRTLDEALRTLPAAELERLRGRWLPAAAAAVPPPRPADPGTPPLRVGFFPADRPFTLLAGGGEADGIGIELTKAVARRAGLEIGSFVPLELPQLLRALAAGEIDLALGLTDTRERRDSMAFVGPYRSNPLVIISRQQYSVWDLHQLSNRRLAMLDGFFGAAYVRAMHPTIDIVPCARFDLCLDAVASGQADAALYGLHGAYQRLIGRGSRNLQITGVVAALADEQNFGLSLKRQAIAPALHDALEVALREDLPRIELEWAERDASRIDGDRLRLAAALVALALLALAAAWWVHSRRLTREIARTRAAQVEAEGARQASERYLAFMTHELRNSLQSVSGAVDLLHRRATGDPALLAALGRSARSTLGLVDGLLDRHRLELRNLSPRLQPASLAAVVAEVVQDMAPAAAAKGLELALEADADAHWLQLDALRVQQVLRNLLVNAVKFSDRGRIVVRSRVLPGTGAARSVTLAVSDQGPGVPAAERERIFEPYVSAGGDRPGSGLGLAFCRELARALGGTLTLQPAASAADGGGACFVFAFEAEPAPVPAPPPNAGIRRLLVLEDSPVYALLLRQAFENQGLEVLTAETLAQARERLAPGHGVDLLLTDAHLPDGRPDALLKDLAGAPPAVCMSAEFEPDAMERLRAAGARACLPKDADVASFAREVLRVVAA
jgi:two-component system, NarL family, sensor histidine kinase EvgS